MLKSKYIPVHVPTTGVRRCWGCNRRYAAASAMPNPVICPACRSEHTEVVMDSAFRVCVPCQRTYRANSTLGDALVCPTCGLKDTFPTKEGMPTQTAFFNLPPAPRATAWCLEWRWRPCDKVKRRGYRPPDGYHPEPPNDWQRYSMYNITDRETVLRQAARLRRVHPWRSFRVIPVLWSPTPLVP